MVGFETEADHCTGAVADHGAGLQKAYRGNLDFRQHLIERLHKVKSRFGQSAVEIKNQSGQVVVDNGIIVDLCHKISGARSCLFRQVWFL